MTFVTSEIWRSLQLAANGCSSHVTTSECTTRRTDADGRTDGQPDADGAERNGGRGAGGGRELRFICETRTHPTATAAAAGWGSEGRGE